MLQGIEGVTGYAKNGAVYCEACKPVNYDNVIFCTDETDYKLSCDKCLNEVTSTISN